jgi:hypothetical protein
MRLLVLIILSFLYLNATSQGAEEKLQLVSFNKIQNQLSTTVDLTLPTNEGNFEKIKAEQLLQEFYTKYEFLEYQKKHSGSSAKGNSFEIGLLKTKKDTFRTYVLFRKLDGHNQIIELRIEEE